MAQFTGARVFKNSVKSLFFSLLFSSHTEPLNENSGPWINHSRTPPHVDAGARNVAEIY